MPENIESEHSAGVVGELLGALLGGLVGGFAFLGVKGDEVGVILRNERQGPGLVLLLSMLALAAGLLSVFAKRSSLPRPAGLGAMFVAIGFAPLISWLVPTPAADVGDRWVALALAIAVIMTGLALILHSLNSVKARSRPTWPTQAIALVVGSVCFMEAIYCTLHLEARSQYAGTSAQIEANLVPSPAGPTMTIVVEAERLRAGDDLALSVYGVSRRIGSSDVALSIADECGSQTAIVQPPETDADRALLAARLASCRQQPCPYLRVCEFVAGAQLKPNAFGSVNDSIGFVYDPVLFQHLGVIARVCARDKAGKCHYRDTTVDLRIPLSP